MKKTNITSYLLLCIAILIFALIPTTSQAWEVDKQDVHTFKISMDDVEEINILPLNGILIKFKKNAKTLPEKLKGTTIIFGQGFSLNSSENTIECQDFFYYLIDRNINEYSLHVSPISELFKNMIELGWEDKLSDLLPEALDQMIEKINSDPGFTLKNYIWGLVVKFYKEYEKYLNPNDQKYYYQLFKECAQKYMEDGAYMLAAQIYMDIGDTINYKIACVARAESEAEKKYWPTAVFYYEKAGNFTKAIEMLNNQITDSDNSEQDIEELYKEINELEKKISEEQK